MIDRLNPEDAECLVMWPKGSIGEQDERELMKSLIDLCNRFGYGRVPQVAAAMEEIWRYPDKKEKWQKVKDKHMKFLEEERPYIEDPLKEEL